MDIIEIRKYTVDNKTKTQTNKEFWEYYINDVPLSEQLDIFFQSKESILENWIGSLSTSGNSWNNNIKVKQLLGKKITDEEIKKGFPPNLV